ncbi:undecaprenyl-diphosphatase [Striga asiatica]|uniref:Undecaprenyl-diphosphatase n=1 Tax=Striga asiatica TaxID=4170 RepID=A0A5A7PAI2_STRAF|nr:undecaprenyl-diphosphatase [Striga asiatica]
MTFFTGSFNPLVHRDLQHTQLGIHRCKLKTRSMPCERSVVKRLGLNWRWSALVIDGRRSLVADGCASGGWDARACGQTRTYADCSGSCSASYADADWRWRCPRACAGGTRDAMPIPARFGAGVYGKVDGCADLVRRCTRAGATVCGSSRGFLAGTVSVAWLSAAATTTIFGSCRSSGWRRTAAVDGGGWPEKDDLQGYIRDLKEGGGMEEEEVVNDVLWEKMVAPGMWERT